MVRGLFDKMLRGFTPETSVLTDTKFMQKVAAQFPYIARASTSDKKKFIVVFGKDALKLMLRRCEQDASNMHELQLCSVLKYLLGPEDQKKVADLNDEMLKESGAIVLKTVDSGSSSSSGPPASAKRARVTNGGSAVLDQARSVMALFDN